MLLDFVGGFYEDSARGFDYQRCINWYPSISQSGNSKTAKKLVGVPGKRKIATITPANGSGSRGTHQTVGGRAFGVWGDTLYEWYSDGTYTDRNSSLRLSTLSGNVSFADNGIKMMFLSGGIGYVYTLSTNALATITDPDFPANANQVEFDNGYFIVSVPGDPSVVGSNAFYVSAVDDPTSWDGLDFQPMSSYDKLSGVVRAGSDVWIFGESTSEAWRLSGGVDFPYSRINGSERDIGTRNPWAIGIINERAYFLGSNKDGFGAVWRTNGYSMEMVSTDSINGKITTIGITNDATAYTYQEKGHYFYCLTVPTLGLTFCYDETTNLWHERASWNASIGAFQRDRSTHHCFAFGNNYVTYSGNNNLYKLDSTYYLDDTNPIKRLRVSPHIPTENKLVRYNKIELEFERGQGLLSGQGSDPKVMYRFSNDGGFSWEPEQTRGLGLMGEYDARATWHSQGMGRDRLHEISLTDPVFPDIFGMYVDLEVLRG
jgi:hypothetical protein